MESVKPASDLVSAVEELKHKRLEPALNTKSIGRVKIKVSVSRVISERIPEYVKVSEDELYGKIIPIAEGF